MKLWILVVSLLLLGGCATYRGDELKPGEDGLDNVLQAMGQPAMRWQNADGSVQLAYPHGPMGFKTHMAYLGPDGKLRQIENVMDTEHYARIRPGMRKEEVLRILGPSFPGWTAYFKARDELVWEWRYCDEQNQSARFDVLFDNSKATVRSTLSQTESQLGLCRKRDCLCAH